MKIGIDRLLLSRLAIVLVITAVLFSSIPVATGIEADAAVKKPGRIFSIKALDVDTETAKLHWGKASGKVSGYAIFRNGKCIKTVSNKTFTYKEKKLKNSTTYKYYVKAFRYNGRKVRRYYNTNTKKWQKKAPPKKYRGKTRMVKVRVYGKASPTLKIKTIKPTMIHGEEFTPSMCPKTFIKKGTKCEECGKGQTVKVTFKDGKYNITLSGTDRSKKCDHK